ncbi:MAG: helix-turn-helix transcriptional regulator [Prolixibacteraceae bacterium]|nr:helix-turn-helix transcriptional regulator [Prolixibacteraceae bacterium]
METNLLKKDKSPIPAGIFGNGMEPFWYENEKWVIAHADVRRFDECDSSIQQPIWKAFLNDKQSLAYLSKIGVKKASESFDRWYRCVVGGLDHVSDIVGDSFTPDAFNNMCSESNCPHRGLLCGRASGLRSFEIETIRSLMQGKSMEQTAESLYMSLPAIKSRVSKLHEKFEVTNTVALIALATQLGL